MPTLGSPLVLIVLALINAGVGVALTFRTRRSSRLLSAVGLAIIVVVMAAPLLPGAVVQPGEAYIRALAGGSTVRVNRG